MPSTAGVVRLIGAVEELSTERQIGMGMGLIPVSMIWRYLERHHLPDWWEPVILQVDAAIVAAANSETHKHGDKATHS